MVDLIISQSAEEIKKMNIVAIAKYSILTLIFTFTTLCLQAREEKEIPAFKSRRTWKTWNLSRMSSSQVVDKKPKGRIDIYNPNNTYWTRLTRPVPEGKILKEMSFEVMLTQQIDGDTVGFAFSDKENPPEKKWDRAVFEVRGQVFSVTCGKKGAPFKCALKKKYTMLLQIDPKTKSENPPTYKVFINGKELASFKYNILHIGLWVQEAKAQFKKIKLVYEDKPKNKTKTD